MEYKSNRITLKEFIMLRPSQKGEFLSDQESFDYTSLHTNDTLSNAEEVWSLSSSPLKKSSKSKPFCNTDPNAVTLKDMVVKRQRNFIKEKTSKKKNNEKTQSKKIKKDYYDDKNVTSASFAKRQHTQKWNVEETKKFYKVFFSLNDRYLFSL